MLFCFYSDGSDAIFKEEEIVINVLRTPLHWFRCARIVTACPKDYHYILGRLILCFGRFIFGPNCYASFNLIQYFNISMYYFNSIFFLILFLRYPQSPTEMDSDNSKTSPTLCNFKRQPIVCNGKVPHFIRRETSNTI